MMCDPRLWLAFLGAFACGSEADSPRNVPNPVATMEAAPPIEQASVMSVRSAPATVAEGEVEEWRNLVAQSRTQRGGGMRSDTPAERRRREALERAGERARNISPDQASRLVKAMLNAGMNAAPDDPCARVRAIYDLAADELQLGSELHEEALQRCLTAPRTRLACLKPEDERSPFERRVCRRFFRDTDAPDLFGETMRRRERIVRDSTMGRE